MFNSTANIFSTLFNQTLLTLFNQTFDLWRKRSPSSILFCTCTCSVGAFVRIAIGVVRCCCSVLLELNSMANRMFRTNLRPNVLNIKIKWTDDYTNVVVMNVALKNNNEYKYSRAEPSETHLWRNQWMNEWLGPNARTNKINSRAHHQRKYWKCEARISYNLKQAANRNSNNCNISVTKHKLAARDTE